MTFSFSKLIHLFLALAAASAKIPRDRKLRMSKSGKGKSSSNADSFMDLLDLVKSGACYVNSVVPLCVGAGDTTVTIFSATAATEYCCPTSTIGFSTIGMMCPAQRRLAEDMEAELAIADGLEDSNHRRRLAHLTGCTGSGIAVYYPPVSATPFCCAA